MISIPHELLDSKEYRNFAKEFGDDLAVEFFGRQDDELKASLAACSIQKGEAEDEMKANANYKAAAEIISDFRSGLREALKPLRVKTKAALLVLSYRKKNSPEE